MTRRARRILSASIAVAMAAGLLLAPAKAGAATNPGRHRSTAAATPPRMDPAELRRLLDQIVAAGAPGATALIKDERGVSRPPAAWPTSAPGGRCNPGCTIGSAA